MIVLTRHFPSGGIIRLMVLQARSRNLLAHLGALVLAAGLYLILRRWASFDAAGDWGEGEVLKQFAVVHVVPALLAGIIGMAVWSPFGETERVSAISLACLRAILLVALVGVAAAVSVGFLSGWVARQEGIDLTAVALRNLLGMTGMALLVGRVLDARLTWLAPVCWSVLVVLLAIRPGQQGVLDMPDWVWSVQPQTDTSSTLFALSLFLAGGAAFLHWGPKETAAEA